MTLEKVYFVKDVLTVVGKYEVVFQVLKEELVVGGLALQATMALDWMVWALPLEEKPQIPDCVEEHLSTVDQETL